MQTYSLYVLFSFSIITMFFFWITIFDAIVSQKMLEPFIFIIFVPLILLTIMANCKKGFALILLGFLIDQIISFIISLIISIKKLNKKIFKNNIKPRYILYFMYLVRRSYLRMANVMALISLFTYCRFDS